MMLDLKKLFPNSKFPTAEELKAKEDTFSIGDRVKVSDNIRCRQHGQVGTIARIDPEDEHGWKSFVVKFDDKKYNSMGFHSGNIDKINEKEITMKKINENAKVTLTIGQLRKLIESTIKDKNNNSIVVDDSELTIILKGTEEVRNAKRSGVSRKIWKFHSLESALKFCNAAHSGQDGIGTIIVHQGDKTEERGPFFDGQILGTTNDWNKVKRIVKTLVELVK